MLAYEKGQQKTLGGQHRLSQQGKLRRSGMCSHTPPALSGCLIVEGRFVAIAPASLELHRTQEASSYEDTHPPPTLEFIFCMGIILTLQFLLISSHIYLPPPVEHTLIFGVVKRN